MANFAQKIPVGHRPKIRSAAETTKGEIRRRVLNTIGPANARVLDTCAGAGAMHDAVWKDAAEYTAIDYDWWRDSRRAYVGDARRIMRNIDLTRFNTFDIDPFGSPWEILYLVARNRPTAPGERLGLVITDGSGLAMKVNSFPEALMWFAGISRRIKGGGHHQEEVLNRAIDELVRRLKCRLVTRWQATMKGGSSMRHIGLILEAEEPAPAP